MGGINNVNMFGKAFVTLLMGGVIIYMLMSMVNYGEKQAVKDTKNITEILDKALVQCYALEGSYPSDITHLRNYGVILQPETYIYDYTWIAANMKPGLNIQENKLGRPEFE